MSREQFFESQSAPLHRQAEIPRWKPNKSFSKYPAYSQAKAWGARLAIEVYYEAGANGAIPSQAENIASMFWQLIFGKPIEPRTLRRRIEILEERGGIVLAPIEAYADGKSVPHPKARKPKS